VTIEDLLVRASRDVERGWLPACQLAVARHGELLVFETFGSVTNDTSFCIFSATKPLVASAIWILQGEGALRVERPVADYVAAFDRDGMRDVTVEQVLLHTCGFPNAPMGPDEGADGGRRRRRLATWTLEWPPGSRFEYHPQSAHWVLAELIDQLSGIDYRRFIEERISAPLGLLRLLGPSVETLPEVAGITWVGKAQGADGPGDLSFRWDDPAVIVSGVPGGGAVATAAQVALFYQALLHDQAGIWDPVVLADATGHIRCTLEDPMLGVPVNRSLGLVIAGDDGLHTLRYGAFAEGNSPRSFGHAGAHVQVAWADPATGTSFAYLTNGLDTDTLREGARGLKLSNLVAALPA
jgi:CubicO group peptidase (beta-lactamase class C family)